MRNFAAGFLSCLLLIAAVGAFASLRAADWVSIAVASYHSDRSKDYNERNWGVGFERTLNEDWRVAVGEYRNSLYRTTVYAGLAYAPMLLPPFRLGAVIGVATGYGAPLIPAAVPIAMLEAASVGMNVLLMPKIGNNPAVLGLQVKLRWD